MQQTRTFTAQVGPQWHKEAMSNGKCNKPWRLSPRVEGGRAGGREGEGSRGGKKKMGQTDREQGRERERETVAATLLQPQEGNAKCQRNKKKKLTVLKCDIW